MNLINDDSFDSGGPNRSKSRVQQHDTKNVRHSNEDLAVVRVVDSVIPRRNRPHVSTWNVLAESEAKSDIRKYFNWRNSTEIYTEQTPAWGWKRQLSRSNEEAGRGEAYLSCNLIDESLGRCDINNDSVVRFSEDLLHRGERDEGFCRVKVRSNSLGMKRARDM